MGDKVVIHEKVREEYPDFLRDESRIVGEARSISFPKSESDVRDVLSQMCREKTSVTTQGARTGITGGAVPQGGHVLNLSRMTGMLGLREGPRAGTFCLTVQPGVLLSEVQQAVAGKDFGPIESWSAESRAALDKLKQAGTYCFQPDPTETTASIGGMASCNASGARTFAYGPTRRSVDRVRVVLADGSAVDLRRGRTTAAGRRFGLETEAGRQITGTLPAYEVPCVKSAAGYCAADDMDMVDLFIGSEGTLGIITEVDVALAPAPKALWGVTAFFSSEENAVRFVQKAREREVRPLAIEFLGPEAIDLLKEEREDNPVFRELPELDDAWRSSVYVEYCGESEDAVEEAVLGMSEAMVECGGNEESTWIATTPREIQRFKEFRHAVPEAVNRRIDERRKQEPDLTKLGTDLAVPDESLEAVIRMYHDGLDRLGLEYLMFGHIGNNHVHVNVLPHTMEEYERGKALYAEWAANVVAMGGTVSAEHGIGKLKRNMLELMVGPRGIAQMRAVKLAFDPDWMLNVGNLFTGRGRKPRMTRMTRIRDREGTMR